MELTAVQQCIVKAVAAGETLTSAAQANHVDRVTVYRWMKTNPQFSEAVHQARTQFALATQDPLSNLNNRAMETLAALLDNPDTPPSITLKAATFILQLQDAPTAESKPPIPTETVDAATKCYTMQQDFVYSDSVAPVPRTHPVEKKRRQKRNR